MLQSRFVNVANMSLNVIREDKTFEKIAESTIRHTYVE